MQYIVLLSFLVIFGIPSLLNHIYIYRNYEQLPLHYYSGRYLDLPRMVIIACAVITYLSALGIILYWLTTLIQYILT